MLSDIKLRDFYGKKNGINCQSIYKIVGSLFYPCNLHADLLCGRRMYLGATP